MHLFMKQKKIQYLPKNDNHLYIYMYMYIYIFIYIYILKNEDFEKGKKWQQIRKVSIERQERISPCQKYQRVPLNLSMSCKAFGEYLAFFYL